MCIFPTDFLRTHFQPTSKSPQKFAERPYLSENQNTILLTQYVGFVVIVGLKPSKPTLPPHVIFIFRVRFLQFSVFTFPFSVLQRSA